MLCMIEGRVIAQKWELHKFENIYLPWYNKNIDWIHDEDCIKRKA